jgi:hypothetical protein
MRAEAGFIFDESKNHASDLRRFAAEIEACIAEPAEAQPTAGSEYVLLAADEIKRDGDEFWSPFSGWCRCLSIGCPAAGDVVRRKVAPQAAPTVELEAHP